MAKLTIDRSFLVDLTRAQVAIDSRNPSLVPGGPGEGEAAMHLAGVMRDLGLETELIEVAPGRFNVVGRLAGSGGGRTLLLNGHLDTVGVEGMAAPFSADVRDGRVYGRGSQDMKGSLAAMVATAKALIDGGVTLRGDLLVTAVADEEYASIGMEHLVGHVSADGAIVTEPTDMALCRAHRGFAWYEVASAGRAAHGSRYQEGIDANIRLGRFLAALDRLEHDLRQRPAHPLVGTPSLHVSFIKGGSAYSVYAAHAEAAIERRTAPGETAAQALAEIEAICERLNAADPTNKFTVTPGFSRSPFEIAADRPIVQTVDRALAAHLGRATPHVGATFWTDAALLADAGIETVLLGPIGAGLHSDEEWVDIQSLVDLAAVMADSAVAFCG